MATPATFGELFRTLRKANGETLREFCRKHGFDAGNMSKLERGRLPPPQDRQKLEDYADALGITDGSDNWYKFFDLARVGAGKIPPALLSDQEVAARLPLLFRTIQNRKLDAEALDRIIELIGRS